MPGPATEATLAAVRRAWDQGSTVRVVSYRSGAADIAVPVAGPLAGWRLEQVRRHYGSPAHVVLVVQRGAPFSELEPAKQMATAAGLVVALRRFERATLVVGEDPGTMRACLKAIAKVADCVVVAAGEAGGAVQKRYKLSPGAVCVEEVEPYPAFPVGVEAEAAGLYRPEVRRGLSVVDLPSTTLAQRARVRVRGRVPKSMLARRLRGH